MALLFYGPKPRYPVCSSLIGMFQVMNSTNQFMLSVVKGGSPGAMML